MDEAEIKITASGKPELVIFKARKPEPCTFILFGATGDLTARKLVPALYNLEKSGSLPEGFAVVGIGRTEKSSEEFRADLHVAVGQFSRTKPMDSEAWNRLAARIEYVPADPAQGESFATLHERLDEIDRRHATGGNRLYYLATPPSAYPAIIQQLRDSGLLQKGDRPTGKHWPRVVVEKPFGRDIASSRDLNRLLCDTLDENQIFRVDHYLGKETVQNIMVFRFGNAIFEPIWNRKYIDHVQITAAEEIGVGHRGRFYDETGVLRDVIQNHLLQVLALIAMEPPVSFEADAIRDEKVKVFRALRPIVGSNVKQHVVFGQYRGYRDEPNVASDSRTPTYTAIKAMIDNWRWQGVPIYLRAGKKLKNLRTEVSVHFRSIPFCLFGGEEMCPRLPRNILTLRIQPHEGISLSFASKPPGDGLAVSGVSMEFGYVNSFGEPPHDAYERLLMDCMRGDQTLFTRRDGVEHEWKFVTPIIDAWESSTETPITIYEPGSAGPPEADMLIGRSGRKWNNI